MKFIFKGHKSNLEKGEVLFHFGLEGEKNIDFTEKIYFPPVRDLNVPQSSLNSILQNLSLILGISYWKLYCPKEIIIESNFLTKEQAQFWNIVYTKGLGEFFYKNKIDFRRLVSFPYEDKKAKAKGKAKGSTLFLRKDRALLGLGGGKDSIVVAETLKAQGKDFDLFTVGTSKIQQNVAFVVGKEPIIVKRELDSKLLDFNNEKGVYNGHIPISVIYAFLGLMVTIFYDCNQIIVANEKSANYGNTEYLGEIINHQWSKSEEFEKLFQEYIRKYITQNVSYSSPLRNLNELEVTKEFVKYPKYFKVFSSCNRNFTLLRSSSDELRKGKWCGKCAKCLFVFIMLSAFLPKETVLNIFGKNLLNDEKLLPLFKELIGIKDFKPFECVGTPEEVKEAMNLAYKKGEYANDFLMKTFLANCYIAKLLL